MILLCHHHVHVRFDCCSPNKVNSPNGSEIGYYFMYVLKAFYCTRTMRFVEIVDNINVMSRPRKDEGENLVDVCLCIKNHLLPFVLNKCACQEIVALMDITHQNYDQAHHVVRSSQQYHLCSFIRMVIERKKAGAHK